MAHDPSPSHAPADIDPSQVERAEHGWHAFTKYGKWFTLHVVVILVLMAIFLL